MGDGAVGGKHQHVALAELLDGNMDHPVVARWRADRDGAAGHAEVLLDRPHVRRHQTFAPLRLVNRGDARLAQPADHVGVGAPDVGDDFSHLHFFPNTPRVNCPEASKGGEPQSFFTGGVPWVWNVSIVFSPQACPFLRSASVQTTGSQSGARISRAPAFANSIRLPAGSQA